MKARGRSWSKQAAPGTSTAGSTKTAGSSSFDCGFLVPLPGFTPANMLNVIAMCSGQIDHAATALLTAEIMGISSGTAFIELYDNQVGLVSSLPGVLAAVPETEDESPFTLGDSRFLRASRRRRASAC